jgi:CheY-like chemotaxis protein
MGLLLVVEDDRNQRLLLQEELEGEGYSVLSATNGEEALARVRMTMPDLVVLDIHMRGMDGLELLGKLLGINNRLPVVIHTAYDSYQDNFMSWAADAYVLKQSDLSELKATIRRLLGEREPCLAHTVSSDPKPWATRRRAKERW